MNHVLCFVAAFLASCVLASAQADRAKQPLPFSHKSHLALHLKCAECHSNTDSGESMSLPGASKCMLCHVSAAKDRPSIQKLAAYQAQKQEIPWVRIATIPDWVYWNHRTHLDAKIACESCHGPVQNMEVMARETTVTTMGGCVACHQRSGGPTGCLSCHEGKH